MGLIETVTNIGVIFTIGVLGLTPIALIDGYFTQQKILSRLDGIKQEIPKEEDFDADW